MRPRILIVEDEKNARSALERALSGDDLEVVTAASGEEALERFAPGQFAVVLTDVKLGPGIDGLEVQRRVRASDPQALVIVMTAYGSIDLSVRAMREGAYDFIEKPLDLARVRAAVASALAASSRRAAAVEAAGGPAGAEDEYCGIIGRSPAMRALFEQIERVAPSRAAVLVTGENGTGKELVARAIHRRSTRASGPMIEVHLAAASPTLIEDELFGHEAGAFTDARARKLGVFERADSGTLFLDEIGEVPEQVQVKLLRLLQERRFERIGGGESIQVDVRFVFATNKDLEAAVEAGEFREDLFYRINVIPLELPPLRERREDIPLLVRHFVARYAAENERDIEGVEADALERLTRYDWPGNVRQLENEIQRAVVLSEGDTLSADLFRLDGRGGLAGGGGLVSGSVGAGGGDGGEDELRFPLGTSLQEVERVMILRTLDWVGGNKTQAAKVLGISPRTLYRKLDEYDK